MVVKNVYEFDILCDVYHMRIKEMLTSAYNIIYKIYINNILSLVKVVNSVMEDWFTCTNIQRMPNLAMPS